MLKEFEFYHGIVFARMLHGLEREISLKPYPSKDNASYIVDDKIGIYIKFSTKRMSPWRFSFQKRHEEEILEMKEKLGEVFLLLVCHDDGIVTLDFEEFKKILNEGHGEFEWISASRNRHEMYSIKGSDGKLEFKIGKDDFPRKLFKIADPSTEEKNIQSVVG